MSLKRAVIIALIITVSFAAVTGFFIGVAMRLALLDVFLTLTPTAPILKEANILILGLDRGQQIHRSDTIMVLHVNPEKKQASLVAIPRDTLVIIPGKGLDKVNHAFAYGGVELTQKTIEDFLHVKIPYYVMVDLKGIERLIDELGGIWVNVEKRMYYVDYAGDLHIDLQPGYQKLNGHQAMGYLRFRHTDNDFARINRQQNFINSITAQLMKRENVFRSPQVFLSLLNCVESNLNSREILGLSLTLRAAYETSRYQMTTIPGSDFMVDGIYYWRPDEVAVQKLVGSYRLGGSELSASTSKNLEN